MGNSFEHFPTVNTKTTESKCGPSLLCDEILETIMSGDPMLTVEQGHPSMDSQILLLDDSSDIKSELDSNLQEGGHVYHDDKPNEGNDMTQSTETVGDQDHTTVFLRIMLNYMLEDGTGFQLFDNVSQGVEHYETYSGYCLTIEKSKIFECHQYGCRVHKKIPFHLSFGYM